jgi:hypothetical protein
MSGSNFSLSFSLLITLLVLVAPNCIKAQRSFELVKSFPAQEAFQAVAVDSRYFYAIASRSIGKYDKTTGKKILTWQEDQDGAILHLDSGVIIDGYLYAAHSNYPELPMTSSVEIWDTKTLKHTGSHSFGIRWGSCTWLDRYDGAWWAVFAHYNEFKDQLGKDNRWTTLVKFNNDWDPLQSWVFPEEVLKRFDAKSNSGGSWGSDDLLYLSGHDRPEIYAMRLPKKGSILELEEIIPVVSEGQGIAWDRSDKGVIYTISRDKREVNILKLRSE